MIFSLTLSYVRFFHMKNVHLVNITASFPNVGVDILLLLSVFFFSPSMVIGFFR